MLQKEERKTITMESILAELLLEAERRAAEGNFERAYLNLKEILEINDDFLLAYSLMGKVLYKTNKFLESESYLKHAIERDSEDFESRTILGKIKFKRELYEQARSLFDESLEIEPAFYENYYYLGVLEELYGNDQKAEELFTKSFDLSGGVSRKALLKTKDKDACFAVLEFILNATEGMVPNKVWSNLSYVVSSDFTFFKRIISNLEETLLQNVDFERITRELCVTDATLSQALDYFIKYCEIAPEIFPKIDKLVNSERFTIL